ncbi:eukaryotic translation initiation factor 2-alpha kinase, partial [Coemansia spiralis]
LWASGLRTDFLYKDDPEMTMERLVDICRDQGMNWIVTLKRRAGTPSLSDQLSATRYTFKVKNILRRVESEVSHENLCDWLHTDIAEQNRMDLQIHGQRSTAPSSEPAAAGMPAAGATTTATAETAAASALVGRGGRLEVVVVDPQRKAKHVNRARYKYRTGLTDRAQAAVTRVLGDVRGAPVLVVDEGPELVRRMAGEQSILSDAGYKRVVEQSSPHQRAYIVELRALLERYHREGTAHVWLYAAKGDIAIA